MLCVFLMSDVALTDVSVDTTLTEGLTIKLVSEPKAAIDGKRLSWESVGQREQITILGSINFQKPTPSSDLKFSGCVCYKADASEEPTKLAFEIPFNFVEMMRELPMSTSEYYAQWKNCKAEQKVDIKTTLRNTRLFAEKTNKVFHVAMVDVNEPCMFGGGV